MILDGPFFFVNKLDQLIEKSIEKLKKNSKNSPKYPIIA